ncbi:MAG: hypothetical protein K0R06_2167 [Clostridium sp.]|jgi:hypothetical protein|nr:hypothetical protein [Clostridium sp.]
MKIEKIEKEQSKISPFKNILIINRFEYLLICIIFL